MLLFADLNVSLLFWTEQAVNRKSNVSRASYNVADKTVRLKAIWSWTRWAEDYFESPICDAYAKEQLELICESLR